MSATFNVGKKGTKYLKSILPKAQDPNTTRQCFTSHHWSQTAFCLFLPLYLHGLRPEVLQEFCILLYFFNEVTYGLNQHPRGPYCKTKRIYRNRTIYPSISFTLQSQYHACYNYDLHQCTEYACPYSTDCPLVPSPYPPSGIAPSGSLFVATCDLSVNLI